VPALQDKIVVFTSRKGPSPFYDSFVAGDIKLDIRRLSPSDVTAIALGPERQEQQNVRKLKGLDQRSWEKLVDLIDQYGNQAPLGEIGDILELDSNKQEAQALAARANMTAIVRTLHDKSSQLMDMLIYALSRGKLCIIDVSRLHGSQSLILSGLILRRVFDRNQEEFTKAEPKTIPTIAVVEEAQLVLNEKANASDPYIAWVKEGRKYDLGALLITQQLGSIPVDILSQGDNWFLFHSLSAEDLTTLQRANAHFSADTLSILSNKPTPGQGVFWSSVGGKPYPVSLRALSFERMYRALDPTYTQAAITTFVQQLKIEFQQRPEEHLDVINVPPPPNGIVSASSERFVDSGKESQLALSALARMELEEDNWAIVGKAYSVQVGISRSKLENFEGEPFHLFADNTDNPISFDVWLYTSENIQLTTEWHKHLHYDPHKLEPQLVEFTLQVIASGFSYLIIEFYQERRWLTRARLEFEAIEKSQLATVSSEV
jgi:hypothetical protein